MNWPCLYLWQISSKYIINPVLIIQGFTSLVVPFSPLHYQLFPLLDHSSVQLLSCVQLFETSWTAAHRASLSITNSHSLAKLMSIESVMPSNHLILCYPLLLLPSIYPSTRVFPNESVLCIRGPKIWSFRFSISLFKEYSRLISFRIDWFDLLEVHRTLKSLLQQKSSFFQSQKFM